MRKFISWFVRDERGVSAMEYAVLAGIVAVALGLVATQFQTGITAMFTRMFQTITTNQG
ncbi:MAG: pilus assembly protein Flp/PilA [Caballeronia sp.]|nr:pilus assembly protein Flp/PilA [Caballeronia sp.]